MKRLIGVVLFFANFLSAQETVLFEDEVILHLNNFNNLIITAAATRILNQGAKWSPIRTPEPYTIVGGDQYDIVSANNYNFYPNQPNFDRIFFDLESDQNLDKTLALSLYKLTFVNKNSYFYIYTVSKDIEDVHITFDYANDKLYWGNCTTCTSPMNNNAVLFTFDNYDTYGLENYWNNCLFVIPSETGNHPRLVWGPYPGTDVSVAAYEIWFETTLTANSSPVNWTKIAETGANTFSYVHESLTLGHTQYAHYKIRTTDNATLRHYSSFSNIATIQTAEFSAEKKAAESKINNNYYFGISNYPNPFNPTTSISYSIPEDGFTELKVYNIYGELVETLLSENKTAGSYSVQFPSNGKEIASGVYLYTLSSDKYYTSGKMIMMK